MESVHEVIFCGKRRESACGMVAGKGLPCYNMCQNGGNYGKVAKGAAHEENVSKAPGAFGAGNHRSGASADGGHTRIGAAAAVPAGLCSVLVCGTGG